MQEWIVDDDFGPGPCELRHVARVRTTGSDDDLNVVVREVDVGRDGPACSVNVVPARYGLDYDESDVLICVLLRLPLEVAKARGLALAALIIDVRW